jgi:uncharacterized membrane protein YbaN (DUF454 family)
MAERSSNDSDYFDDMLNGRHEEHKIHPVSCVEVVVFVQVLVAFLLYKLPVRQLAVDIVQGLLGGVAVWVDHRDEAGP